MTTTGGIVGKVTRLEGDLVSLKIAENVEIHLQKAAVSSVLPKGTINARLATGSAHAAPSRWAIVG